MPPSPSTLKMELWKFRIFCANIKWSIHHIDFLKPEIPIFPQIHGKAIATPTQKKLFHQNSFILTSKDNLFDYKFIYFSNVHCARSLLDLFLHLALSVLSLSCTSIQWTTIPVYSNSGFTGWIPSSNFLIRVFSL